MFIAFLAAAAAGAPKAMAIDPVSWFSADDYPVEARRKGIEGSTTFEVDVDAQGKPTACRISRSSGSPILDQKTCEVVLRKGQFKPALVRGKTVPGRYSRTASWRLEGSAANSYFATIVDFRKDPDHPTCTVVDKGMSSSLTCEQVLQASRLAGGGAKLTKLVALQTVTTGEEKPYRGEPDWGQRLWFVAIDLFPPKEGAKTTCTVVAQEGAVPEADPCDDFVDAGSFFQDDRKALEKAHFEQSLFVIPRRSLNQSKCKDGESAAEVQGCG